MTGIKAPLNPPATRSRTRASEWRARQQLPGSEHQPVTKLTNEASVVTGHADYLALVAWA